MRKQAKLNIPARKLGLASLNAESRSIDWREAYEEDGAGEGWHIVFPRVTLGDIAEHAADLLTADAARRAEVRPYTLASEGLAERFEQERGGDEWRQGFEPMMSFVWPLMIPTYDGLTAQEVADRIARFAPTATLVEFGEHSDHCPEEYGLALSGGGMNLSDQLAAAYLCAEQVPPVGLLSQLSGVIDAYKLAQIGAPLRASYRKAAQALRRQASRMGEESARIFRKA